MLSPRPKPKVIREFSESWILHQDDALIVLNKPAGLPSQPSVDRKRSNLYDLVCAWRKASVANAYVGLHHRLDRDTSGVMFMTLLKSANKAMGDQVREHRLSKIYRAVCADNRKSKKPLLAEHKWRLDNHLAKTTVARAGSGTKQAKIAKMKVVNSGGDRAITDFQLLSVLPISHARLHFQYLIEARPQTGRMHQIRIHLAESGLPIYGDHVYAPEDIQALAGRSLLHAYSLGFLHPLTGEAVNFTAPMPEDFPHVPLDNQNPTMRKP